MLTDKFRRMKRKAPYVSSGAVPRAPEADRAIKETGNDTNIIYSLDVYLTITYIRYCFPFASRILKGYFVNVGSLCVFRQLA